MSALIGPTWQPYNSYACCDRTGAEARVCADGDKLPTPVRCAIRPRALRVVVPRERPGVPAPKAALEWPRLRQLASFRASQMMSPSPPSQVRSQARNYGRRRRAASPSGLVARCPRQR